MATFETIEVETVFYQTNWLAHEEELRRVAAAKKKSTLLDELNAEIAAGTINVFC